MGVVIPFTLCSGAWTEHERMALSELQEPLAKVGLEPHLTTGVSDEGDAWASITAARDQQSLLHVARSRSGVVLIWRDGTTVRDRTLWGLLNTMAHLKEHIMAARRP